MRGEQGGEQLPIDDLVDDLLSLLGDDPSDATLPKVTEPLVAEPVLADAGEFIVNDEPTPALVDLREGYEDPDEARAAVASPTAAARANVFANEIRHTPAPPRSTITQPALKAMTPAIAETLRVQAGVRTARSQPMSSSLLARSNASGSRMDQTLVACGVILLGVAAVLGVLLAFN